MHKRVTAVAVLGLLLACGWAASMMIPAKALPASEQLRQETFRRHAALSEQAREAFDQAYDGSLRTHCTPESLAEHFGLSEAPRRTSRASGGYEMRIELPKLYSRLIMMWSDDDQPTGYAWEIMTPASNNVTWDRHRAAQAR